MTLSEKIRAALAKMPAGKTQAELARRLRIPASAVVRIKNGERSVKVDEAEEIVNYLGIDGVFPVAKPVTKPKMIAVSGIVEAGAWRETTHVEQFQVELPAFPSVKWRGRNQYVLQVRGSSMNRHYKDGDYIYCVPLSEASLHEGAHVHVVRVDGGRHEETCKVLRQGEEGWELWPDSDDPQHKSPVIYDDKQGASVEIRGVVIGMFRDTY